MERNVGTPGLGRSNRRLYYGGVFAPGQGRGRTGQEAILPPLDWFQMEVRKGVDSLLEPDTARTCSAYHPGFPIPVYGSSQGQGEGWTGLSVAWESLA